MAQQPAQPNHAATGGSELWWTRLGTVEYRDARSLQHDLRTARLAARIPDALLLLEHPATYTCGRRAGPDELPMGLDWYRDRGFAVEQTDRGGRVTFHGPGQLVAYPIVSLRPLGDDVVHYIRVLEAATLAALGQAGIEARLRDGLTGVWVEDRKIASIGVHVSRGVTTHGVAINSTNDLAPFGWIVPCGMAGCRVTSIEREAGRAPAMDELQRTFASELARRLGRALLSVEPTALAPVGATA